MTTERSVIEVALGRMGMQKAPQDEPNSLEVEVYTEGAYGNSVIFTFDAAGNLVELHGYGD